MRTIQTFQIETLDNKSRESIHEFFLGLEKRFSKEGLGDTIYNVVQELVTNAVKANLKRTFFQSHGFVFDGGESYAAGLSKFKESLNTISQEKWKEAAHELGFKVTVEIDVDEERVLIFVENNAVMIPEEELRLRARLARAMKVRNLIRFSEQYGDDTEGEGLGLALVIMLIKDAGFDPDYFRVFTRDNSTVARLEFPLLRDYIPIRQKWQAFGKDDQK